MKSKILKDLTFVRIFRGLNIPRFFEIPADGKIRRIGRHSDCEISIFVSDDITDDVEKYRDIKESYKYVSRIHAEIIHEVNGCVYIVPKSKNPTFIGTEEHPFATRIYSKEQIFPDNLLVLGRDYMMRLELMDVYSLRKTEEKMRKSDTSKLDLDNISIQ